MQYEDSVQIALEQIDIIKQLTKKYHNDMEITSSISGITSNSLGITGFKTQDYNNCYTPEHITSITHDGDRSLGGGLFISSIEGMSGRSLDGRNEGLFRQWTQ